MLDVSKIARVYSGKIGCMCGCKGKYTYNAGVPHEGWQGKENVRTVRMFTRQLMSNPAVKYEDNFMYVEENGRIKVAFFKESA